MQKLSVLFWLKKNKVNKRGEAPIYCRITLSSYRCPDFSTGKRTPISEWNSTLQKCSNEITNMHLSTLRHEIETTFLELYNRSKLVQPMELYNRVIRKECRLCNMDDVLNEFLRYYEWLVEVGKITFETYKHVYAYRRHIDQFLEEKGYMHLQADKFDLKHCEELAHWMLKVSKTQYRVKIVYFVVNAIAYAREKGMINLNPCAGFKMRKPPAAPPVYLTWDELTRIVQHRFASKRLQECADRFIWQCFTGQAWGDLEHMDKNKYVINDGHTWLEYSRAKNDQVAMVPLLPQAMAMLQKYPVGFPPISGQKYNAYLKEIADIVGIEKRITSHTGRKTFGHIMENRFGISIEAVAAMMGHTDSKTTRKYYTRIDQNRIIRELEKMEMVA